MKIFFNIAGGLALILGIIGIALPLLPTTPFLLLAAACFLRGSARMHRWMTQNPVFGRYLLDYQEKKGVTLRVKIVAIAMMWLSLLYSMFVFTPVLRIPLGLIGLGVTVYLIVGLKTVQRTTPQGSTEVNKKTRP